MRAACACAAAAKWLLIVSRARCPCLGCMLRRLWGCRAQQAACGFALAGVGAAGWLLLLVCAT
eukprot:10498902-Alexandrium_andersonii.AAC.1